jgi:hypothetical protein
MEFTDVLGGELLYSIWRNYSKYLFQTNFDIQQNWL